MIIPYKQTLSHSCLAVCMLMLREKQFTEVEEHEITISGSRRMHQFYVAGIPLEFVKQFDNKIVVHVDNKYFANVLQKIFSQETRLRVVHKKITQSLIKSLLKKGSLICHIDDHALGDYSHASHFIILERMTDKFIHIIDPWAGERKMVSTAKLEESITDLKNRIKMCPLLFSLDM